MANNVLLNNVAHQNLKVIKSYGVEYGHGVGSVLAFPTEFIELQKEYPILFRKNPETQKFHSIALLGLAKDENLFLDSNAKFGWAANYIPAVIAKGPFLIGFQSQDASNTISPVVHIDLDHPSVSETDGAPIFLEHGGNSTYLDHVAKLLKLIHHGMAMQDSMFEIFSELDLLEPIDIDIELNSGEKYNLVGNYTINEEKLAALPGARLEKLSKIGLLPVAYAAIASLTNIRRLTEIKNDKK